MAGRVATIGTFDGVHCGHRVVVDEVKRIACERNLIPTVFAFANHPLEIVAPERVPAKLMSFEAQLRFFETLSVEVVPIYFNEELRRMQSREYMQFIRNEYDVEVLVVGYDNRFGCNRDEGFEQYASHGREIGMEVIEAPEMKGVSSTIIRKLLEEGEVAAANEKLGYFYTVSGIVEEGKQLGRTIGFPTANLCLDDCRKLVPANGVYVAKVELSDGRIYGAMVNIGHCPTVEPHCNKRTIEVNIFDFAEDIYGEKMNLSFVDFMRKERKMNSVEELRCQLIKDKEAAQKILKTMRDE